MAWIESHQSLARHRKTLAAAAALKVDRHKLIGHLHELWWWGIDNADIMGHVGLVHHTVIAEAAGWPAMKSEIFVKTLTEVGFLDLDDEGLVLHDWYEYAGKLNERRDQNKERMRAARSRRDDADSTNKTSARAEHVQRTTGARAPATGPNRTGPGLTAAGRAAAEGLVDAFYEAVGCNGLTRTLRNREITIASQLLEVGASPAEAREFVTWCRASSHRPVPRDMRVYETARTAFLGNLGPIQPLPTDRNGRPEPTRRIIDNTGRKMA